MQTILGSTGSIGTELAKALPSYTSDIRLVSRSPKAIMGGESLVSANLLNAQEADIAIAGSEIVYLTVGLPYHTDVWQRDWPILMQNVIDACKKYGSRLVFFDNVYPYGIVDGWMTEDSPIRPASVKGEARAKVDRMVMEAVEKGEIEAILARAADFYGITPMAYLHLMVFENLTKGKKAQYLVGPQYKHSFTHIKDAAIGSAILGNTPEAFNQTWHLPTDMNVLTGKEWVELVAEETGAKPNFMTIPKWMMKVLGFFNKDLSGMVEMLYQNERDYLFSCEKFNAAFDYRAMTAREGVKYTLEEMREGETARMAKS